MKRVASLYLPDWPIDRLRRAANFSKEPDSYREHCVMSSRVKPWASLCSHTCLDQGWHAAASMV